MYQILKVAILFLFHVVASVCGIRCVCLCVLVVAKINSKKIVVRKWSPKEKEKEEKGKEVCVTVK